MAGCRHNNREPQGDSCVGMIGVGKSGVFRAGGRESSALRGSAVKIVRRGDDSTTHQGQDRSTAACTISPRVGLVRLAAGGYSSRPCPGTTVGSIPNQMRVTRMDQITRPAQAALIDLLAAVAAECAGVGATNRRHASVPATAAYSQPTAPQTTVPAAYPQTQAPAQPPVGGQQQPVAQSQLGPPQPAPPWRSRRKDFSSILWNKQQLDRVLDAWQAASGKIKTFKCRFRPLGIRRGLRAAM